MPKKPVDHAAPKKAELTGAKTWVQHFGLEKSWANVAGTFSSGGSMNSVPNVTQRIRSPRLWTAVVGALAVALLLAMHGMLPWLVSSMTVWFSTLGGIECGALSLSELAHAHCALVGGEAGGSIANGLALVALGSVLARTFGLTAEWAYALTAAVLMSLAFAGAHQLARRLGLGRVLSLVVATFFLSSPTIIGMVGFGSTFWGAALVPAVVLVGLRAKDGIASGPMSRRLLTLVAWWFSVTFMLALDGYGYVMSQFMVGVILAYFLLRSIKSSSAWISVAGFGLVNLAGFLAYRLVLPEAGGWERSSIDVFRAMGADLSTLVLPSSAIWWSRFTGAGVEPSLLWGDGSNARYNYLGFGLIFLAVIGFSSARKRLPFVVPLALIAGLATLLSLGPSLKVGDLRGPLEIPVTYASYLMPSKDAVFALPTTWFYENLPGLVSMRATYRWLVVTRIALLLLAGLGVQRILTVNGRGIRRVAALGLCALVALEVSPDVAGSLGANAAHAEMVRAFDREVLVKMRAVIPPDTRIVFAPNAAGENDFLANYLAPMLRVHAYNVGGDKALASAVSAWPEPVARLLLSKDGFAPATERVLADGYSDMVVIPFFDLRWSSTAWPTPEQFRKPGLDAADEARADPRLLVEEFEHFATVRLTRDRGATQAPVSQR